MRSRTRALKEEMEIVSAFQSKPPLLSMRWWPCSTQRRRWLQSFTDKKPHQRAFIVPPHPTDWAKHMQLIHLMIIKLRQKIVSCGNSQTKLNLFFIWQRSNSTFRHLCSIILKWSVNFWFHTVPLKLGLLNYPCSCLYCHQKVDKIRAEYEEIFN